MTTTQTPLSPPPAALAFVRGLYRADELQTVTWDAARQAIEVTTTEGAVEGWTVGGADEGRLLRIAAALDALGSRDGRTEQIAGPA